MQGWKLLILGLFGCALGGCGAVSSSTSVSRSPSSSSASTPRSTVTTNAGGQTTYHYDMPASPTPTTCSVYMQGHDAQITFDAQALNVASACNSWIQSSAASAELWQNTPSPSANPTGPLVQVCSLSDNGQATATIDDTGGEIYGQQACEGLLAAGTWTDETGTMLNVGNWTGQEPLELGFSGDAGNVVTGITWSTWTASGAVGHGTSIIQNCIPNCAQGSQTTVPATITLSDPEGGQFMRITETRNGTTSTVASGALGWPMTAS